jgi:hypothetical protein
MRTRRFGLLSLLLVPIGVVAGLIRRRRRTRPGGGFGGGRGGPDAGVREPRRPKPSTPAMAAALPLETADSAR